MGIDAIFNAIFNVSCLSNEAVRLFIGLGVKELGLLSSSRGFLLIRFYVWHLHLWLGVMILEINIVG